MTSAEPSAALKRLFTLADTIPDRGFGARLHKVFAEAGRAAAGLGNLPLGKYDDLSETGAPDLSLWEELAPVIRDTLLDVNRILSAIREQFPAPATGIGSLIDESLEPTGGDSSAVLLRLHIGEATEQIQRLGTLLATEVSNLGERMRSPQIVSDRWNLMSDLQEFRGKFRSMVGDLLFLTASAFDSVTRVEVIPGYSEELKEAIAARRSVTDVARVMAMHRGRVETAKSEQLAQVVAALVRDLDAFGRSRTYGAIRTPDKRRFVEFRALVRRFPDHLLTSELVRAMAEFADFVQGLSGINRRTMLVDHDREVVAACAVLLETADQLRATEPAQAMAKLQEAVAHAGLIYGRNPSLDSYLRKSKKRDLGRLNAVELANEVELLRGLLAAASAL